MKSIFYPLLVVFSLLLNASCAKWLPENRIVGTWKLVEVEKRRLFDKQAITTGYENGTFTFNDGETAQYSDAIGPMNGNWRMRKEYYGENDSRTTFTLRLYNFNANRIIDWEFDRMHFRRSGDMLVAFMERSGYNYRYEFRKE